MSSRLPVFSYVKNAFFPVQLADEPVTDEDGNEVPLHAEL